eukprot:TRINITY_DN28820_c0_g1_i1.p1 TRINITY_DN28820_c0_g1~~TRINITY_DN28820_c0_g1_i1.p1  ORF type:complete len:311 (+),score=82.95 TRINITY_DN28820_c0_g1_i1:210-1142(+)
MSQTDHVFFFGDLSYRLNPAEDGQSKAGVHQKVVQMAKEHKWRELWVWDELAAETGAGRALYGFTEAEQTGGVYQFEPTYKVKRQAQLEYDGSCIPAWCDRILWKSLVAVKSDLRQEGLRVCGDISTSDHKPVQAQFALRTSPLPAYVRTNDTAFIKFHNLQGRGLKSCDIGGQSDPYVVFRGSGIEEQQTHAKRSTLNPDWQEAECPPLRCYVQDREALSRCTLILVIVDSDMVTSDDFMGSVQLHLGATQNGCAVDGDVVVFDLPVVWCGQHCGNLKGSFSMVWEKDGGPLSQGQFGVKEKGGCCVLA